MFAYSEKSMTRVTSASLDEVFRAEADRQTHSLMLLPGAALCSVEAGQAGLQPFQHLPPDGAADLNQAGDSLALVQDGDLFDAWARRFADKRNAPGLALADRLYFETLSHIRQALGLLAGTPDAGRIHVSPAATTARLAQHAAVTALAGPGAAVLTLDGESRGSFVKADGAVDLEALKKAVAKTGPAVAVVRADLTTQALDWPALRGALGEVKLIADVTAVAGPLLAGLAPVPFAEADVVLIGTRGSLCGPSGAVLATTSGALAQKIDASLGELQGPAPLDHLAALGAHFEMIVNRRTAFAALQQKVLGNGKALAAALNAEGLTVALDGTATPLVLVDLSGCATANGRPLDAQTAALLLESAGIVCAPACLPGDKSIKSSRGLLLDTTWLSQRGVASEQLCDIVALIKELFAHTAMFSTWAHAGEDTVRGRAAPAALEAAKARAIAIAGALPYPKSAADGITPTTVMPGTIGRRAGILVRGEKARLALEQAATCSVLSLKENETASGFLLRPDGTVVDHVGISYLGWKANAAVGPNGEERLAVFAHGNAYEAVAAWLRLLSDGLVLLSEDDPYRKVDGPFAVGICPGRLLSDPIREAVANLPDLTETAGAPREIIDPNKPYFVGIEKLAASAATAKPAFEWQAPEGELRKTVLHGWHVEAGAKMVPFGGWDMPVEYPDGIFAEHAAVRAAAGLFDVSHMTVLEFTGPNALPFLENVVTSSPARLAPGEAQYGYMVKHDAVALDDLYVYKVDRERYLMVVNAGNTDQDVAWFQALNEGAALIDPKRPGARVPGPIGFRSLRDAGAASLIDLAFQGPLSLDVLVELADTAEGKAALKKSAFNGFFDVTLAGIPVLALRTGYTGENMGFELLVHPDQGVALWQAMLEKGKDRGVRACGLGARDSLRIEAGFPLFGHELEGPESLSLNEADYPFVTRFHKPFFVGREAYIFERHPRKRRLLRLKGEGRRSVRAGHAILDDAGKSIGTVTSFAFSDSDFHFTVLAAVQSKFNPKTGSKVRAYRATPEQVDTEPDERKIVDLTVESRFPTRKEKGGWQKQYAPYLKK